MDISIYMMANKMSSATVRVQLPIGNWPSGWYTCYHGLWLGYNQVSWPHETMASIAHVAMLFLWQFWDNFEHLPWQHWLIYNSVSGNCDRIECDTSISLASGCWFPCEATMSSIVIPFCLITLPCSLITIDMLRRMLITWMLNLLLTVSVIPGCDIWNALPNFYMESSNIDNFKRKYVVLVIKCGRFMMEHYLLAHDQWKFISIFINR